MGPIEEALKEKFFPMLLGGGGYQRRISELLGHSVNHGGLVILDLQLSAESAYKTSNAASGDLFDSLLGGSNLY